MAEAGQNPIRGSESMNTVINEKDIIEAFDFAISYTHKKASLFPEFYTVEDALIKARDARQLRAAVRKNVRTYIGVIIGMLVFLFLSCGIAEYVVIKLIGG